MIFEYKILNIRIIEFWFNYPNFDSSKYNKNDLVLYLNLYSTVNTSKPKQTAITDLSLPNEMIYKFFDKTTQYEINRCSKNDGIKIHFKLKYDQVELNNFFSNHSYFQKSRKLPKISYFDRYRLNKLYRQNSLVISTAETNDGKLLLTHVYIYDSKFTRLLYSINTTYKNLDIPKNLFSRANRLLHWQDMLYFKEKGLTIYDWGGIYFGNNQKLNSISKFKLSFGGRIIQISNNMQSSSTLGKSILSLRKVLNFKEEKHEE